MKKFYVLDQSGNLLSEDGKKRYRELKGKALLLYIRSEKSRGKVFHRMKDDRGDDICVELPEEYVKEYLREEKHRQYLWKIREESGISELSMELFVEGEETTGEELLEDANQNVENLILDREEIQLLRAAILKLNDEEQYLLKRLFLSEHPIRDSKLARELGVSPSAIHQKKIKIFHKIRRYMEAWNRI